MKNIKISIQNKQIIIYFFVALLACFAFLQVISSYGAYTVFMAVEGICGVIGYYIYERCMIKKEKKPSVMVPVIMIGVFVMQCLFVVVGEMINCFFVDNKVQWPFTLLLFLGISIVFFFLFKAYNQNKITAEQTISILIFIAFLFHLLYAQFTGIANLARQNDTIQFTNGGGHLGYIWHVWAYGTLPDVDPRTMWEFSQPPLYYLLSGYWIKISSVLGVPILKTSENIQFFSVLCVTLTTIYLDKIMKLMGFEAEKRIGAVLFLSCIPYTTYLSGAVNNDVLLVLLTVMAFYYALKWYENPKLPVLIIDAVITGLLVMSKSSGALVAPAIAAIFIMRLLKDKGSRGKRIAEYLLYGAISLPLGLWWNIRNVIRFGMPFLYVNEPSTDSIQYIPEYSIWERLFDTRNQLNHLYIELFNTSENVDHNIIISTLKTLTFTHSAEMMSTDVTLFWGSILYVFTILLVVLMIIFGFIGLWKGKINMHHKIAWAVLLFSYLVFYLYFNVQYPFVHTMHARYILPVIYLGIPWMLAGMKWLWTHGKFENVRGKKVLKYLFGGYAIGYFAVLQCYMLEIVIQAGERI